MSYKDLLEKAQNGGQLKDMSATYHEWSSEGDFIVGEFIDCNKVASSLGSKEYYQYLFQTDEGLIKFHLGAIMDSEIAPLLEKGRVYYIEYQGKQNIAGGRKVNRFKVQALDLDSIEGGAQGDDVSF